MLLTNLAGARDSQTLWWIVQIYRTRWKIGETFLSCTLDKMSAILYYMTSEFQSNGYGIHRPRKRRAACDSETS